MLRNLDLTALRSLVAISDTGGVTKAANRVHLTQSAVSMQIKRLEDSLGLTLIEKNGRSVELTASGHQLAGYARKMLALNDEVLGRLLATEYEGEITLGVPHDIVYPTIPEVLRAFNAAFPRMKVQLLSSFTRTLKEQYVKGEIDMILTTEPEPDNGAEPLAEKPLIWVGAPNGTAWRKRTLPMAFETRCMFRPEIVRRLDAAGIPWDLSVDAESTRSVEAAVSADLAVHALLEGTCPPYFEIIDHGGALPTLSSLGIHMYLRRDEERLPVLELAGMVRDAFDAG